MLHTTTAVTPTAYRIIADPALRQAAAREHATRLAATPYECPIPPEVNAPVVAPPGTV